MLHKQVLVRSCNLFFWIHLALWIFFRYSMSESSATFSIDRVIEAADEEAALLEQPPKIITVRTVEGAPRPDISVFANLIYFT